MKPTLPVIEFISNEPGHGQLMINGMPIPGVSSVAFEVDCKKPSLCRVTIAASAIKMKGPAQIAMELEEIKKTE